MSPLSLDAHPQRRWLSVALLCAMLLLLPALTWLLAPGPGRFVPPPSTQQTRVTPTQEAPPPRPRPTPASTPAAFQPKPAAEEPTDGPVSGVVLDPDGKPVKNAFVGCDDRDKQFATNTNEEGRFELPAAATGCLAISHHPNFGPSERVELRAGENTIHLGRSGGIEGVVVDETGSPLSPYLIAIESFTPADKAAVGTPPSHQARSIQDPNGAFTLERLAPGRYILTASADGRPPVHSDPVEVEAGRTTRNVRISLPRGATLTGKVIDAETHNPIAGAVVGLDAITSTTANSIQPSHTDESGSYKLEGVPAGPFSIRVAHERYRTKIVPGLTTNGATAIQKDVDLQPRGDGGAGDTELAGIGAVLVPQAKGIIVSWLTPGGPAQQAGLRPGDVIHRIDGVDASSLTLSDCIQRLRGPEGSRVLVSLRREGEAVSEVMITRKNLTSR